MAYVGKERPGVYSDYEASSILWGNPTGKTVGLVAVSDKEAGQYYTVTRTSDADSIFTGSELMRELCKTILQNGAIKVMAVSAGTDASADGYDTAFSVLETMDDICAVVCDSEDVSIHDKLKLRVDNASQSSRERIGIVSYPASDNVSELGRHFNSERIVVIAQSPTDSEGNTISSCFLAAALAGMVSEMSDPSASINSKALNSVLGLSVNLSEDEVDNYIRAGVTPFEIVSNQVEVIRAVSSRTTTDGISDLTFKDINTILIIDYVISGIRKTLKSLLDGAKNNNTTRAAIATQVCVELEKYKSESIIDSYKQPLVYQDDTDQSVCVVEVSFEVSRGINQIYITADVKV